MAVFPEIPSGSGVQVSDGVSVFGGGISVGGSEGGGTSMEKVAEMVWLAMILLNVYVVTGHCERLSTKTSAI